MFNVYILKIKKKKITFKMFVLSSQRIKTARQ